MFKNIVDLIARVRLDYVMLAYLFVVAGYRKLFSYEASSAYMQSMHVPSFVLPLVILLELGGGIAIIIGFLTRFTSVFIALFSVIAAIIFHQGDDEVNSLMFMKDIGLAGGVLLLAVHGSGKFSVDNFIKNRLSK